ncbi:MAG: hypothetical protein VX447_09530 [Pseudomonadota bacterium]|nr:hypothetical protein [Pseudomonadota bacterium]
MNSFKLELHPSELKLVLEGLMQLETEMAERCAASDDPDVVADTGNDLIELRLLLKPLQERAVAAYGQSILNFSRDEL